MTIFHDRQKKLFLQNKSKMKSRSLALKTKKCKKAFEMSPFVDHNRKTWVSHGQCDRMARFFNGPFLASFFFIVVFSVQLTVIGNDI